MKELLEAGVHFGHQVRRWNPKMKEYIFGERNGIYIIDLQKTQRMFREAIAFVTNLIAEDKGKTVLFVGTKRQAQDAIREESEKCGQYFVNQRWLGGLLTNFQTVQKSIKRLKDLESMQTDGRYEKLTKKERIKLDRERESLEQEPVRHQGMSRLPDAIFIIDVKKEEIAVAEAIDSVFRSSPSSIQTVRPKESITSFPATTTRLRAFACLLRELPTRSSKVIRSPPKAASRAEPVKKA
jgi:small subunit ribosomal protein S2